MIKVSVFYPFSANSRFDMDYYLERHVPMVRQKLGRACKGKSVEQGVAGGSQGSNPTYAAMGHLLFDSLTAFEAAFGPNAAEIMTDAPNYTDIDPVIQISDIRLS